METKTKVDTYEIDYECDCGGYMRPNGMCYATNPPKYSHYCNKCDKYETFCVTYPYTVVEKIK